MYLKCIDWLMVHVLLHLKTDNNQSTESIIFIASSYSVKQSIFADVGISEKRLIIRSYACIKLPWREKKNTWYKYIIMVFF